MFWGSILVGAVTSPSFTPKATSTTLEFKSGSQFTEEESICYYMTHSGEHHKLGVALKIEQTDQDC